MSNEEAQAYGGEGGFRSPAEIAALFAITDRESEHLSALEGCVQKLREVQAAKVVLAELPGARLREALELRRTLAQARDHGHDQGMGPGAGLGTGLARGLERA